MIRKSIFFISFIFASLSSYGVEGQLSNFTCITEHPTTSFVFDLEKETYTLNVIHHNGIEHAPFYSGVMTLSTWDYLQSRIENMKQLGSSIKAEFHKSECLRLEKNRITCYKKGASKLGPLEVTDLYFNVYENSDSSTYGVFKDVRTSFEYRKDGQTFRMPMSFPESDCSTKF
jgi:tRNA splicing endonuclease